MKNCIRYIALVALLMASLPCWAQDEEPVDTVFFYKSWQQMLDDAPEAVIMDPVIELYSPYEAYFLTIDEKLNESMYKDYVAASIGDSTWLVSSYYLQQNFTGDIKKLEGYVPIFFNERTAFITFASSLSYSVKLADFLFDDSEASGNFTFDPDYYYLDFINHKILKVNHKALSSLLEDYHDLLVRYEGMKDYKKPYIIKEYFYKFVDRASADIMRPYIVDLVPTGADSIN